MIKENEKVLLMKILSNKNRQRILNIIYGSKKDMCVYEIAEQSQISQSLTSHQLAYLSANGVVEGHRSGQTICYLPAKNALAKKLFEVLKILSR
jgi:DNA-binding transcriptional ArsR family regulator